MRTIVVFLADTHAGHRLGLLQPGLTLYEEDDHGRLHPFVPQLTETQKYLWRCYQEDLAAVQDLANGDPIIVYHVGDLTQGLKYRDQLVSSRLADQILIAKANLTPWLQLDGVKRVYLIVGTPSHVFAEGTSPILLKEILQPTFRDTPIQVSYHSRPTIDGVIFDCAHHGPSSGIREWTQGNQLRYYLKSLVIHDVLRGRHPPHLTVRAHFHKLWPETVSVRISRALLSFLAAVDDLPFHHNGDPSATRDTIVVHKADIVLMPSYCGMGEHGRKATGSTSTISNGLIAAEVLDGSLHHVHYFERELDLRQTEVII